MVARKKIGLLLMFPENIYQQRIMSGIFSQCEKYDYDVIVFAPQAQITNYYKDYLQGELNIFEYVNFDLLDGVIVAPLTMNEDRITTVCDLILKKLKNEFDCKEVDIKTYSPLTLAFIGDCVFDLVIRTV